MAYNFITSYNSPNYTPQSQSPSVFGQPRIVKGITIHWWGNPALNPTAEGVRDYLCRQGGNSSAHIVATGTGRKAYCIVNFNDVAWHAGNATGNATTIGIELDPRCRDEDYDVAAEVVADIRSAFGDVPIYSHKMWTPTACPGNYDIDRIDQMSYKKYSHPTDWGKGGDKAVPPPAPAPQPPAPTQQVSPTTQNPDGTPLPDTGKPVAEKDGFTDSDRSLLQQILDAIKSVLALLSKIFK